MIKILPGSYFHSVEENQAMNRYIKEKFGTNMPDYALDMYFKEKYNGVYVPGNFGDVGYFLFENERDALMFTLKWS